MTPPGTFHLFINNIRLIPAPLPASDENEARLHAATDSTPWALPGGNVEDANKALRLALQADPDTLFLFINGDFPDNRAAIKSLRDAHQQRGLRVHVVAFVPLGTDAAPEFVGFVQDITDETGADSRWLPTVLPAQ